VHVEGYHLLLENGDVIGHLYYAPSEKALFPYLLEPGASVLYCEWVQRKFQNQGLGKHLFETFVEDQRRRDSKGILTETRDLAIKLDPQNYLNRGFRVLYERGDAKLLYLPLTQAAIEFHPLTPHRAPRHQIPIEIVIINGYMCPPEVATQSLLHGVAQEFGERVKVRQVWLTPETLKEYGSTRGILINGKRLLGSGETEESIRAVILEELQHAD